MASSLQKPLSPGLYFIYSWKEWLQIGLGSMCLSLSLWNRNSHESCLPDPGQALAEDLMWLCGHACFLSILGHLAWTVASSEQPSSPGIEPNR